MPATALILGSGLSETLATEDARRFSWQEIPGFPTPTVEGHEGVLSYGEIANRDFLLQGGRIHYYEGQSMDKIVFSVRVMALLGVKQLIITNAAGAINEEYEPGDLVSIKDHINASGDNPLIGLNREELGPRFPDMSEAYTPELRSTASSVAADQGTSLREGVYLMTTGPSYETPAEIRAFSR
ncbi:MAG: purine-nucleoside phosphorylase, partial [Candidatus Bipolaricaulia bacterium]